MAGFTRSFGWRAAGIGLLLGILTCPPPVNAQDGTPLASHERLRQETILKVRTRLGPLLEQFCREACTLIDVAVDVDEAASETDDLGFEGLSDSTFATAFVSRVGVEIQVDDRVTSVSRERLLTILRNNLAKLGANIEISWLAVTIPQIGQSGAKEQSLERELEQRVENAVDGVIDTYCPEDCVLSSVVAGGRLVTADEAAQIVEGQLVRDKSGDAILRIESVDVIVGMNSAVPAATRTKITNVLKAKTRFAAPLTLDVQVAAFPESQARKDERRAQEGDDQFGLERMRRTLQLFRELSSKDDAISADVEAAGSKAVKIAPTPVWEYALYAALVILLLGVVLGAVLRFASAARDARMMVETAGSARASARASRGSNGATAQDTNESDGNASSRGAGSDAQRRELGLRMRNAELKDDMIKTFLDAPRVAKETFARLLSEEGIEETARYVHIFGHLVVFELLSDPNLQRDLYDLSEYYHKSEFAFSTEDEGRLLASLKTRVTASEIRVLTRKQMEQFDFLSRLDPSQVYSLVADERAQVQSIVLTQLDYKRRRAVFDLYVGQAKVALMRELCRADAIPKEYLANVAKALHKKVQARPEFDTENLRSSDILLDLLEKADLGEQRALMENLAETNVEAARGVKLRLVTIEILPYLKDGHLLEVILGLEREDLLAFLAGGREHIRTLVLSKAPEELAEGWLEDLAHISGSLDTYRLVEMKVLGRIRALASSGAFNLLDVNDLIFGARHTVPGISETEGSDDESALTSLSGVA